MTSQNNSQLIKDIKSGVLRKFPLLGVAMSKVRFFENPQAKTAETDGKDVFYNMNFITSLSSETQVAVFAHEIMHVAFNHIMRCKDKDYHTWNIATDAVINQMLKSQNLPLFKGAIDMPEASGKSAETIYNSLIAQNNNKKQKENNNQNNQKEQSGNRASQQDNQQEKQNQSSQEINNGNQQNKQEKSKGDKKKKRWSKKKSLSDWFKNQKKKREEQQINQEQQEKQQKQNDINQQQSGMNKGSKTCGKEQGEQIQNHEIWKEAIKEAEEIERKSFAKRNASEGKEKSDFSSLEETFVEKNQEMKEELGRKIREKLKSNSISYNKDFDLSYVKSVVSWKRILKRELESEEENWSLRRADEDNFFQSRIEDIERIERAETEVLIDTSGSVSDSLVVCFLRQLKPLLKESKLKVGCFDTAFYGFQEIKNEKDIGNFKIVGRGGTNFELAVKQFSCDSRVNKIVFTDGYDTMDLQDKKYKNIIWIVYRNSDFHPAVGKVINVNINEINKTSFINSDDFGKGM